MKAGIFLKSTSLLDGTIFEGVRIFIAEFNEKGALGFVINHQFPRGLNELEEFKHITPFPLYLGGPVDQEHLYFVHQRPDLISGGDAIDGRFFLGGDFKAAVGHINSHTLTGNDIRIFIGYCGWDHLDLDSEIEEGSWQIVEDESIFDTTTAE